MSNFKVNPTQDEMRKTVVSYMWYNGENRDKLDPQTFVTAYLLGDGFGTITRNFAMNEVDFDWSHIRDSSEKAIQTIYNFLRLEISESAWDYKLPNASELVTKLKGRKGLRSSRPIKENGLIQYMWREARFKTGADTTMPTTSEFWLMDWCEENNIQFSYTGYADFDQLLFLDRIDRLVSNVLILMGLNPLVGVSRWHRAFFG